MTRAFSSESANWIPSTNQTTFISTLPTYEDAPPFRVNREGVNNYLKNRGSLNIGDWAIEGTRPSTASDGKQESHIAQPKVLGSDALNNYTKNRCTTPHFICGPDRLSESRQNMRVRHEGRAIYEKHRNTEVKALLGNYEELSGPTKAVPRTQGEIATNLFYTHQEGQMGPLLNKYGSNSCTPRRGPSVKGVAAEENLYKGYGDSQLLQHGIDNHTKSPEPHVKGDQAYTNYDLGQGHGMNELLHQYGNLQQSARAPPKVKFEGVGNLQKGQGDEMRKALSQCPPTIRQMDRRKSGPFW